MEERCYRSTILLQQLLPGVPYDEVADQGYQTRFLKAECDSWVVWC